MDAIKLNPFALVALSLALSRCASEPAPSGGSAANALLEAFIAARCDAIFRCDFDEFLEDAARCRSRTAIPVRRANLPLLDSLAAGRTRVDDANLQQCVARLNRGCLAPSPNLGETCRNAFVGTVPMGSPCTFNWDCAGDAVCLGQGAACPRTCRPAVRPGGACPTGDDAECAEGAPANTVTCFFTGRVGDGTECLEAEHRVVDAVGEPCGLSSSARGRAVVSQCGRGLFCPGVAGADGRFLCEALLPLGATCFGYQRCAGRARCLATTRDGPMTCQAVTVERREGERCTDGGAGPQCDPFSRLTCMNGLCVRLGDGAVGSRCPYSRNLTYLAYCNEGLYCSGQTGTCQPRRPDGLRCVLADECQSGYCNQTCQAFRCR